MVALLRTGLVCQSFGGMSAFWARVSASSSRGVLSGQGEVVDEEVVFVAVEMEADVGQLVH